MARHNTWGTSGSILELLLLYHFVADLFFILSNTDIANFTDDVTPYISGKNVDNIIQSLDQASLSLFK